MVLHLHAWGPVALETLQPLPSIDPECLSVIVRIIEISLNTRTLSSFQQRLTGVYSKLESKVEIIHQKYKSTDCPNLIFPHSWGT
jgi:ribulose-5-phosphate 4-epimerase/fuculose-1-phosphate aldolase